MIRIFRLPATLMVTLLFLSACTVTGSGSLSGDSATPPDTYDSSTAPAASAVAKDSGVVIFPHLPVPYELEKIGSETVVFTTPEFHGGIFTLKGSISKGTVMDFFQRRLPEEGWRLAGRLDSETCYMAFKDSTGGSCLIQIASANMGLKTEVRIFVSEGTGNVVR